MTADTITSIGGSVVQHGPCNNRIYVIRLSPGDLPGILDRLDAMAREKGYAKIFAKVPASVRELFLARGYRTEACVPGFFSGREDGHFMAAYPDPARSRADDAAIREVVASARSTAGERRLFAPPPGCRVDAAAPEDAPGIAALYREVFETYPFPIHDAGYIARTMEGHIRYFCIRGEGQIVAAASAEMDVRAENVEMTDFATLPEFRGYGLSRLLLQRMEESMRDAGMQVAYTIARALSFPINRTFARAGYAYAGTLLNNTNICGSFESMNVWYKPLVHR
ncbi:beta-lysine acetyltransferase [hydrocarbon metagenome]|uniref:Beta-lysine acetyltransferase n=1 Tax=hydrocarbon metagenome TaxID=938273 RepID=A0A0W8FFU2_9ZZZZ|nr:putative beta-lysine N-acetyltransferase [Methanomicrobiaceae archaeon]